MEDIYFKWPDYLVLGIVLLMSAAIGFYYACTGGKQKTTREYILADKGMHWFPVSCSLFASFVSSQSILATPGEIYSFGTILVLGFFFQPIGVWIAWAVYLPMLQELDTISVYTYIEMRFGKALKYMSLGTMIATVLMFNSLIIYGPALSISAVTGMNIWLAVFSVTLVGLLYTVMGGLKTVLWTDTLQLVIMLTGVLTVAIYGTVKAGGIEEVWRVNKLSGRLDFLEPTKFTNFDPRARHTIWNLAINNILLDLVSFGYLPAAVQRAASLKHKSDVKIAYLITAVGTSLFVCVCIYIGLIIFAHNRFCDPIEAGIVSNKDQLYPLYVMQLLGHLPGVPGLILSSIFSASLSTTSSSLNAGAAIILNDFVKPFRPNLADKHAAIVTKITSLILGALALVLVLFAKYFGSGLFSMGLTIFGVLGSATLPVFTMGIFMPMINEKGTLVGLAVGCSFSAWLAFGGLINQPYIYEYPVTTAGCNITDVNLLANMSSPVYDPSTWDPQSHYRTGVASLYDISYTWAPAGGLLVTMLTSFVFSLIFAKKTDKLIDKRLLSPLVLRNCCLMPAIWRAKIDFSEGEVEELKEDEITKSQTTMVESTADEPLELSCKTNL